MSQFSVRRHASPVAAVTLLALTFSPSLVGQPGVTNEYDSLPLPIATRMALMQRATADTTVPTTAQSLIATTALQDAIDATWGPGLPTEEKLRIFDLFWNSVDQQFAAFQDLPVDWIALRNHYRPLVAAGVSRGRFAAIMIQLSIALRESHTQANDVVVNFFTTPAPGVPLFVQGGWLFDASGACVTALDDGSALVYRVMQNHPLDLRPGDRVLGYDGRPWIELYPELLAAEIPVSPLWWGSSPGTFHHSFVISVTNNGHLFDQIDVLRYTTGQVEHLPTTLVQGLVSPPCTEQMDVAGVPTPDPPAGRWVDFGLVAGTRIGYIYGVGWQGNAGSQFYNAIRTLTQDIATDGLIVDFRFNLGGNMFLSNPGLSLLFAQPQPTIGFAIRSDPTDHFKMRPAAAPPSFYVIPSAPTVNPVTVYDKPIAVLTGPGALSSGDQVALRMTYLPNVRTFGSQRRRHSTRPRL